MKATHVTGAPLRRGSFASVLQSSDEHERGPRDSQSARSSHGRYSCCLTTAAPETGAERAHVCRLRPSLTPEAAGETP